MRVDGSENRLLRWEGRAWEDLGRMAVASVEQKADLVRDSDGAFHRVWTAVSLDERGSTAVTLHGILAPFAGKGSGC